MEDSKPHTRNLKLISVCFILYWLLELKPAKNEIHLSIISYKISNPEPLPVLAWLALSYFFWRFLLAKPQFIKTFRSLKSWFYNQDIANNSGTLVRILSGIAQFHFNKYCLSDFEQFMREQSEMKQSDFKYLELRPQKIINNEGEKRLVYLAIAVQRRGNLEVTKPFSLPVNFWLDILVNAKLSLDLVAKSEDSADYVLPLLLLVLAVLSGLMVMFDFTPNNLVNFIAIQ